MNRRTTPEATVLKAPICLALSGNMPCELTTDRPHNNSVAGLPRHNRPAALPPDENWGEGTPT